MVELETQTVQPALQRRTRKKNSMRTILFLILWLMLILGGMYGAMLYTEQIKLDITEQIHAQTEKQLRDIQMDYQTQIENLEQQLQSELHNIQEQIQTFNELLTFTNDSAKDETDNSNQLYSQLAEVKKQLEQLEKNLDVLQ